ncbi:LysR family transcriptional regulator [Vibrio sp. vnigr-6D03]|uniref:LysR substrate-binding domain-containing protein n=1 Tax=Vibrio sp. vnigr-6D03 TaxID=2058088 RepID=UPI000C328ABA|nr:LysR substrate-binding domain-containing protein [Vibrio sp. vnigr-6D03]PKF81607.1 LysR family transcriptional regulator [Vibrio sp. vnigr-6D03]
MNKESTPLDRRLNVAIVGTRSSTANFDITTLRLFVSVAEQGNIAEASRINHIAASAISKRISDLEARVGVNLLYRLRGGVEPTQAGKAMLRHAKRVLLLMEDMDAELSEFTHGMRGQVRLWANTSSITQFLPEDISRYVERFPEVGIELREETSQIIIDGIREGLTDLGIFSGHTDSGDLETRVYRHDTLMVILPSGHPLEGHEKLKLADIAAYNQVGLQDGSSLQNQLLHEASSLEEPLKLRVRVLSFDGIRRMVEAGLGLAVLPEGAVIPFLEMGTFTAVKLDEPWAKRSLILGFRDYKSLPVVARTLIECLAPEPS